MKGIRQGMGAFFYSNGAVYIGEWIDNKKYGYGLFVDEFGGKKYSFFKRDRVVRDIKVTHHKVDSVIQDNAEDINLDLESMDKERKMINNSEKNFGDSI